MARLGDLAKAYGVGVDWLLERGARDECHAAWPEGWIVLRQAAARLSPSRRQAFLRVAEMVLDAEGAVSLD